MKINLSSNTLAKSLALVSIFALAVPAHATPVDFTPLTSAVDFTGVTVAMLAIGAVFAVFYVSRRGVKDILGFMK